MKKLTRIVAFLLCAMLCVCASAGALAEQGYNVTVTYTADAGEITRLCTDLGLQATDLDAIGRAVAELFGSLTITGSSSAEEVSLRYASGDTVLIDAALRYADGQYQAASNLVPDTVIDVTQEMTAFAQYVGQYTSLGVLILTYANEHATEFANDFSVWMNGLTSIEDYGVFTGDAYSGGVIRTTVTVTDRDLGMLGVLFLSRLDGIAESAAELGVDWNEIRSNLNSQLVSFGAKNAGYYTLSAVSNESERAVGLSITAYQNDVQVATLSVGFDENMNITAAVVSFGYQNQVYALAWNGTITRDGLESVSANGELRLWLDPTRQGYRVASSSDANLLMSAVVNNLSFAAFDGASALNYDVTLTITGTKSFRETYSADISSDSGRVEESVYYDHSSTAFLTGVTVYAQGETTPYTWPTTEPLTFAENSQEINSAFSVGQTTLAANLLTVLPMELKMLVLNMIQTGN